MRFKYKRGEEDAKLNGDFHFFASSIAEWRVGDDVEHPEFGHGWVQGAGHGVVSVRFETRSSGPGPMRTFAIATPELVSASPADSLDWQDYLEEINRSAPPGDDLGDG